MTRTSNPRRANWLNVSAVVLAFLFATANSIVLATGEPSWFRPGSTVPFLLTVAILGAGAVGGYFINKRRDRQRGDERTAASNNSYAVHANWFNVSALILAVVVLAGGIVLIAVGGSFWIVSGYSSLIFLVLLICGVGVAGGYLVNERRDHRPEDQERRSRPGANESRPS